MSKPLNVKTHDAATANGSSEAVRTKGHVAAALFVAADTSDLTGFTATVEVSPDGTAWAPLTRPDGTSVEIVLGDLNADGNAYAASGMGAVVGQQLRVTLSGYTGTSPINTYLITGGWNGPGFGV